MKLKIIDIKESRSEHKIAVFKLQVNDEEKFVWQAISPISPIARAILQVLGIEFQDTIDSNDLIGREFILNAILHERIERYRDENVIRYSLELK